MHVQGFCIIQKISEENKTLKDENSALKTEIHKIVSHFAKNTEKKEIELKELKEEFKIVEKSSKEFKNYLATLAQSEKYSKF